MKGFSTFLSGVVLVAGAIAAAPAAAGVPAADAHPRASVAVFHPRTDGTSDRVAVVPIDDRRPAAPAHRDFDRGFGRVDHGDFDHAFGFGLGWGWSNPYWGWGPGWGWGYGPAYGYPAYGYPAYGYYDAGGIRLQIKGPNPKKADVYVNGGYVGVVDDFNGWSQSLRLDPGPYNISVRAKGYQPLKFKVMIQPDHTIDYKARLERAT